VAEAIQAALKDIGINVEVKLVEQINAALEQGDWDGGLYFNGMVATGDPVWALNRFFNTGAERNWGSYSNPRFDELVNQMSQTGERPLLLQRWFPGRLRGAPANPGDRRERFLLARRVLAHLAGAFIFEMLFLGRIAEAPCLPPSDYSQQKKPAGNVCRRLKRLQWWWWPVNGRLPTGPTVRLHRSGPLCFSC
jgi:hypothetical protein